MIDRSSLILKKGDSRSVITGNSLKTIPPPPPTAGKAITIRGAEHSLSIAYDDLSTGLLLMGKTGCGKTTAVFKILDELVPKLSSDDTMLIFDTKGDYLERYYRDGDVVISASSKCSAIAKSWNIFGELSDENGGFRNSEILSREIAKSIFKDTGENGAQPFFTLAATDIFAKTLFCLSTSAAESGNLSRLTTDYLISFLNRPFSDCINYIARFPGCQSVRNYVGNGSNQQALGVAAVFDAAVSKVFFGPFIGHTSAAGDFSIRKLVRNRGGKIVFLEFDPMYSNALSSVYALFFEMAIKQATSVWHGSTFFICDELNLLPIGSENLEMLVNFGRSSRCMSIFGLQSYAQLEKNYGIGAAKAVSAGFLGGFFFSSVDYESRNFIKQRFGETYESLPFGTALNAHAATTVSDYDIINLPSFSAFVDLKNRPPFIFAF